MKHSLVQTREQFNTGLDAIANSTVIAFDIESNGLELWSNPDIQMVGLAVYTDADDIARYYPFRHGQGSLTDITEQKFNSLTWRSHDKKKYHLQQVYKEHELPAVQAENLPIGWLSEFNSVWDSPELHLAHNAQFDLAGLHKDGFITPNCVEDTMVTASLVNTDWTGSRKKSALCYYTMPDTGKRELGNRGLKWLSRLFQIPGASRGEAALENALERLSERLNERADFTHYIHKTRNASKACLWMLKPSATALYACLDVFMTFHLWKQLSHIIEKWGLTDEQKLHRELTIQVAWPMQLNGFRVDMAGCEHMSQHAIDEQQRITDEIKEYTNGSIDNPGSTQQVLDYLQRVGCDIDNTCKGTLKELDHPVGNRVLNYRKAGKLASYTDTWLDVHFNGRIHPKLNVFGTLSGRWSSSGYAGNFQNIPRKTGHVINPKKVLLPPADDLILIEIDYSQLEIRVGAWIAEHLIGNGRDTTLTDIVLSGADMHNYTRDMCNVDDLMLRGKSVSEWLDHNGYHVPDNKTPDEFFGSIARHVAKTLNFLCMYGGGAGAIESQLSILDSSASQQLVDMWRNAYPAITNAMYLLQELGLKFRDITGTQQGAYQFLRYPMPGMRLVRKFNYYPARKRPTMAKDGLNNLTQGTAGLLTVDSARRVFNRFGIASFTEDNKGNRTYDFSAGLIVPSITVHDSVIFSLRPDDLHIVPDICDIMTDYDISPLTLAVDVEAALPGKSWGSKQEVKDMNTWINSKGMAHG